MYGGGSGGGWKTELAKCRIGGRAEKGLSIPIKLSLRYCPCCESKAWHSRVVFSFPLERLLTLVSCGLFLPAWGIMLLLDFGSTTAGRFATRQGFPFAIVTSVSTILPMATLRRILKYTPAVVLGLLVVAWPLSWFAEFGVGIPNGNSYETAMQFRGGDLYGAWAAGPWTSLPRPVVVPRYDPTHEPLGSFYFRREGLDAWFYLPLPILMVAALPLALGPFLSFRFRLWHYLAYTALVALELTYYLRWQE